jgi:hypothetical protein
MLTFWLVLIFIVVQKVAQSPFSSIQDRSNRSPEGTAQKIGHVIGRLAVRPDSIFGGGAFSGLKRCGALAAGLDWAHHHGANEKPFRCLSPILEASKSRIY